MALIISVENLQLQTKNESLVIKNRLYIKYDFELFHITIGVAEGSVNHPQCIAMTRKRSEWLQIRKAFWQDLGLSRGFRAPSLENAPTPTVYTGYRFVSAPWT